jgi:hypothetical protein
VVDLQPGRKHRFRPLSTRSGSLNRSEIDESDLRMKRGDYPILEIVLIGKSRMIPVAWLHGGTIVGNAIYSR